MPLPPGALGPGRLLQGIGGQVGKPPQALGLRRRIAGRALDLLLENAGQVLGFVELLVSLDHYAAGVVSRGAATVFTLR